MEKEYFLPLFIHGNDPIIVYVAADELIALEMSGELRNQSSLALHLLYRLANNKQTKDAIPKELVSYLSYNYQSQPCICGRYEFEYYDNRCLAFKMAIQEEKETNRVVRLSDFALFESNKSFKVFINRFNPDTKLTAQEAFILFANIVIEARGNILYSNNYLLTIPFDKGLFKQIFEKHSHLHKPGSSNQIRLYCLDYFEYLLKQLQLETINPELILRLSGSKLITKLAGFDQKTRTFLYGKLVELNESQELLTNNQ